MIVANALQPLIDVAEAVLIFLHNQLGFGWGFGIVGLTVVTRLAILPLTVKQIRSMQELQRFQPQIKEIQEKHKHDRQRQQQEMMRFYKEHKVNPLGSCLPLLLQLPVFLALFYALQNDLKPHLDATVAAGGERGWLLIEALDKAAKGGELGVLIVLYVATQMGASLLMAATADRTQRTIMFALPLVFVPIIVNFPAGLVLYWITTNLWTVGQQALVKRLAPPPPPPGVDPETGEPVKRAPPPPPRKKKKRGGRRR